MPTGIGAFRTAGLKPRRPRPGGFDSSEDYAEAMSEYERRVEVRETMAEMAADRERDEGPDPYDPQEW